MFCLNFVLHNLRWPAISLWPTSISLQTIHSQPLTRPRWVIHTSSLHMPEPSQPRFPHLALYRSHSYLVADVFIPNLFSPSILKKKIGHKVLDQLICRCIKDNFKIWKYVLNGMQYFWWLKSSKVCRGWAFPTQDLFGHEIFLFFFLSENQFGYALRQFFTPNLKKSFQVIFFFTKLQYFFKRLHAQTQLQLPNTFFFHLNFKYY